MHNLETPYSLVNSFFLQLRNLRKSFCFCRTFNTNKRTVRQVCEPLFLFAELLVSKHRNKISSTGPMKKIDHYSCKQLWKMSINRYARGVAVPKNGNMRLLSGCYDFPFQTLSTCRGLLLVMTCLFRFTIFISGFAHKLPAS